MKFSRLVFCLIVCPLTLAQPSWAGEDSDQRKAQNFIVLPEIAMASFAAISARPGNKLTSLGWTAKVSDRLWSMNIESYGANEGVRIAINGYIWDAEGSSSTVSFTGTGNAGSEPILIHGRINWPKDKIKGDVNSMTFEQTTKIGKNSLWSWVVGTEIVGCGVAGGISANVLAGGLTAGLSTPLAASIFITGASGGASACISISSAVKETIDSDKPPLPPKVPEAPVIEPNKKFSNEIIVVVNSDGGLSGRYPLDRNEGQISLEGNMFWSDGYAKGIVSK